jgi:hypothetical protein
MPDVTTHRAGYIAALPTFAQSAAMIGIHPSGIGRAVKRLGIEPLRWGNRDKHLSVADLMSLADDAHRETRQTVASRLLDHVVREHPSQAAAIRADIESFFAGLTGARIHLQPARADQPRRAGIDQDRPAESEPPALPAEQQLRSPVEPETARRLVALYTLQPDHDEL